MDALERKVEVLSTQNVEYKKRINNLEDTNSTLVSEVQKLQEMLGLRHLSTNNAFVSIRLQRLITSNSWIKFLKIILIV